MLSSLKHQNTDYHLSSVIHQFYIRIIGFKIVQLKQSSVDAHVGYHYKNSNYQPQVTPSLYKLQPMQASPLLSLSLLVLVEEDLECSCTLL